MAKHDPEGEQEAGQYVVTFTLERALTPTGEPSDYVFDVVGHLLVEDEGERTEVGSLAARVVRIGRARDERESVFDVFDSVDQSLHEFYAALFDTDADEFKEDLVECAEPDLLIIDAVELKASHRGHRLGLFAVLRTIETFGAGCGAVALSAAPLRRSGESGADEGLARSARVKLRQHWSRIGFEPIGETEYMVLDLAYTHPGYEALSDA